MTALAVGPLEVACDGSGNDGENLFGGATTGFAHRSALIAKGEAENAIAELYRRRAHEQPGRRHLRDGPGSIRCDAPARRRIPPTRNRVRRSSRIVQDWCPYPTRQP